jgi:hypothetical protein
MMPMDPATWRIESARTVPSAEVEGESGNSFQKNGAEEGEEDTKLRRGTQEQGLGIGQQRSEIGHSADSEENQKREEAAGHAHVIELTDEAAVDIGDDMTVGTQCLDGMTGDFSEGYVGEHRPGTDGYQQQGLKALLDGQPDESETYADHDDVLPPSGLEESVYAGGPPEFE